MFDDFETKLARVLTEYSQPVQPGDMVGIRAHPEAMAAVEALYEAVLRRGGHPVVHFRLPVVQEIAMRTASADQLTWTNPLAQAFMEQIDVFYALAAPANTNLMAGFDPARVKLFQQGAQPVQDVFRRRFADGTLRWTGTALPTHGAAQQARMGLLTYTEFIYRANAFHHDDPIAHWQAFKARQDRLCAWLSDKSRCEVKGPGIDLSFSFAGRKWINAHGDLNFPDGEIYTGPVEDSVNGHVAFSYPAQHGGREVEGVQFTFKDGVIVEARADKGDDYLQMILDRDEGARHIGEFAIGTNNDIQQLTGSTLFDEKIGGTIHMALGYSIPQTLGVNQSAIHWDMVHDMKQGGEIIIDGELFYRAGEFVVETE